MATSIPSQRSSDVIENSGPLWWKLNGRRALLGIRRQTAIGLGEILLVELPEIGEEFEKGDLFGSLQTLSQSIFLEMPLAGRVTAVNIRLENNPDLVKTDAYGAGWLIPLVRNPI